MKKIDVQHLIYEGRLWYIYLQIQEKEFIL